MFKGFFYHELQWLHEAHKYKWNLLYLLYLLYTEFVQIAFLS